MPSGISGMLRRDPAVALAKADSSPVDPANIKLGIKTLAPARARKPSALAAVVLKRRRAARKRYERQGLLVQEEASRRAEEECLADADIRIVQGAGTG
jgi:hypothetical protein